MAENEFSTVRPGEMLKDEFLVGCGVSEGDLARGIGMPPGWVAAIVNNGRPITADAAVRLGLYFGNSAEFWMNLQTHYDLKLARLGMAPEEARCIRSRGVG